ncbi:MAG: hypothetical protein WC657_06600 [Candidatus Paceibacterota bacterium]|jgi:hypothetical protein
MSDRDLYEAIVKHKPEIVSKSAAKRIVSLRGGRLPKGLAIVTAEQLREIEWLHMGGVNDKMQLEAECAVCGRWESEGHAPGCWFAASIKGAEE